MGLLSFRVKGNEFYPFGRWEGKIRKKIIKQNKLDKLNKQNKQNKLDKLEIETY